MVVRDGGGIGSCRGAVTSDLIDVGSRPDQGYAFDAWDAARIVGAAEEGGQRTLVCWEARSLEELEWIDLTRTVARVAVGEQLGQVPLSETAWTRWTSLGLVAASADMLGAMPTPRSSPVAVC